MIEEACTSRFLPASAAQSEPERRFDRLPVAEQAERLAAVARLALVRYKALENARLSLVSHWENTTFRVDATEPLDGPPSPYSPTRLLLRVHRRGYQTLQAIRSELLWLKALRSESDITAPLPVAADDGELAVALSAPEVPGARVCSVLRWIPGEFDQRLEIPQLEAIGALAARLHRHADGWRPSSSFERRTLDFDGLAGTTGGNGAGLRAWKELPQDARPALEAAADRLRSVTETLSGEADFGLIHGDLHHNNVVFSGGQGRPIDFDDCGWGYRAYEFCALFSQIRHQTDWPQKRDAVLRGYQRHRRLPAELVEYLDVFIAARRLNVVLWMASRAADHEGFRAELPKVLEMTLTFLRRHLGL